MTLENGKKLSPYWQRLVTEATQIMEQRIESLDRKTIPPSYCLAQNDKLRMEDQQFEIEYMKDILKTVRNCGFWGKFLVFDTVLTEHPSHVFRLS